MEGISEQTIGKLHDVGLVYTGDFLPVVCKSEAKSEFGNTLGFGAGNDFEGFDNARYGLMF